MTQSSRTVAQYFVELRKQADRCQFADRDDSIRTKILQTMNDKQLRREAMLKCLPLDKLLKRAANKEDVERQAREMEKNARDDVNRVYEQRKPKKKPARCHAKPPHTPERSSRRQFITHILLMQVMRNILSYHQFKELRN